MAEIAPQQWYLPGPRNDILEAPLQKPDLEPEPESQQFALKNERRRFQVQRHLPSNHQTLVYGRRGKYG